MVTTRMDQAQFYQSDTLVVSKKGKTGQHRPVQYAKQACGHLCGSVSSQLFLAFMAFPNTLLFFEIKLL